MVGLVFPSVSSIVVLVRVRIRFTAGRVRLGNRAVGVSRNLLDGVLDRLLDRPPGTCHRAGFQPREGLFSNTGVPVEFQPLVHSTYTPQRVAALFGLQARECSTPSAWSASAPAVTRAAAVAVRVWPVCPAKLGVRSYSHTASPGLFQPLVHWTRTPQRVSAALGFHAPE